MVSESVYLWLERPEVMVLGSETDTVGAESLLGASSVLCLSGIISLTLNSAELNTVFMFTLRHGELGAGSFLA